VPQVGISDHPAKIVAKGLDVIGLGQQAAAVFFNNLRFEEPCAVAFLEAMAMGKPIVALESGLSPFEDPFHR
jgi:glycosyltransferase involved in cell wall biosynthesis